jgi:L-ribulose-5-phosphate 4-epimerase
MSTTYSWIQEEAWAANQRIGAEKLAALTWGNASAVERTSGVFAIKPSGVPYENLNVEDMVVCSIEDASVVFGNKKASSDAITHAALYRAFPELGGVVHTHSPKATAWAQTGLDLPCLGTTHADHFAGPVPCTRPLTEEEINSAYVLNTAVVIIETFSKRGLNPDAIPAVLVGQHGPFTWAHSAGGAVDNAIALEACAAMAFDMFNLTGNLVPIPDALLRYHYERKHGPKATYGQ